MAGPFDYTIQQSDPFKAVMSGYETGVILNERDRQRAAEQAQAQAQAEQQAQIQRIQQGYYTNPKPSYQDFMQYAQTLDPKVVEPMLKAFQASGAEGQQQKLQRYSQIGSSLRAGKGASAAALIRQDAEAYRGAGDTAMADAAELQAKIAETDPTFAIKTLVPLMAVLPGGPEAIKAIFEQGKTEADIEATQTGILNTKSLIQERAARLDLDAQRLGLDRDRLTSEVEGRLAEFQNKGLPESAQKVINDATVSAVAAEQSSAQMSDLASRLESLGGGYGAGASFAEWFAKTTGNQDAITGARSEYARVVNSAAMKLLPPGPATDKDIQLAMKGFPPETADAKYMASFLRGLSKMQARDAAFEQTKSEWVDAVGYLGKARKDIEVGGVKVPAGTTLAQYWQKNGGKMAQEAQSRAAIAKYGKYAGGQ